MFADPVLAPGTVPGGLHIDFGDLHADEAYIIVLKISIFRST